MLVTIMTDASVDNDMKIGGFGYWIASDRAKKGGGGELKSPINDSYDGELKAVVNTLHLAIRDLYVHRKDTVLIQLDNKPVVDVLTKRKLIHRKELQPALNHFLYLVQEFELKVIVKHVKGHTDSRAGKRFAANNLCDEKAKFYMRRLRQQLTCI